MGSKSIPPPAPDYKGAAEATAAGSRVNQYTPYGNLTYSPGEKDFQGSQTWNQAISLSPVGQRLLNAQDETSLGMAGLQGEGLNAVRGVFNKLPNSSALPELPGMPAFPSAQINPGQTAQQAIMARLQPQMDRSRAALESRLANQGIGIGSEAYKNAITDLGQQENDAYSQAAVQGIGLDQQARNQALTEALQRREQGMRERQQGIEEQNYYSTMPINLLNAIRTGSQVQNPTFGATPQGPNYLGAAQAQGQGALDAYNAKIGQQTSFMSGLMNLGGAAILAGSDLAIKQDVRRIGTHARGFGIYEFRYRPEYRETWGGGTYVGVLAHEVAQVVPHAVHRHPDGYAMVDYGAL